MCIFKGDTDNTLFSTKFEVGKYHHGFVCHDRYKKFGYLYSHDYILLSLKKKGSSITRQKLG